MKDKLMSAALAVVVSASTGMGQQRSARPKAQTRPAQADCKTGLNKAIEQKVKQLVIDELGVDEAKVTPRARFIQDLGADSLDEVELIMRFEEEFNIEISDADAAKLHCVCDVVKYLEKRLKKSGK